MSNSVLQSPQVEQDHDETNNNFVGFEVLAVVVMKSSVYRDMILCNPLKSQRTFWIITV
jgi:hypothetical protein